MTSLVSCGTGQGWCGSVVGVRGEPGIIGPGLKQCMSSAALTPSSEPQLHPCQVEEGQKQPTVAGLDPGTHILITKCWGEQPLLPPVSPSPHIYMPGQQHPPLPSCPTGSLWIWLPCRPSAASVMGLVRVRLSPMFWGDLRRWFHKLLCFVK